ncbi:hypothetical protein [Frankia sp. AvcI1]|uniref:hypothetical protein n=1 Tax=Frankia sp. AvcI1 TaxID=573496 RepID=UPI0002F11670|nr:hypothetical protein [Frankia sp. AvcI1]
MVDGANVIGSRPDGWWRDRPGAARRLLADISAWIAGSDGHVGSQRSAEWPTGIVVVLEGAARAGVPAAGVVVGPTPAKPLAPDAHSAGNGGRRTGKGEHSAENGDRVRKVRRSLPDGDGNSGNSTDPSDATINDGAGDDGAGDDGAGATPTLTVVHAPGSGDDAIVDATREAGPGVVVITSDRGLAARVRALGAEVRGAGWLRDRLRR